MRRIPARDHYFKKAKAENYAARSVYKLKEMDQRLKLFRPGQRILDLGAAPGSWSQYAAQRIGAAGRIVAVDLQPPAQEIEGVEWLISDVVALDPQQLIRLGGRFDVVLSDMAPRTTGQKSVDAARSTLLAEAAFDLAWCVLKIKGKAVVKVFMGQDFPDLLDRGRTRFKKIKIFKPDASLRRSRETYLLAWEPVREGG